MVTPKPSTVQCRREIDGPKVGKHVVAWRNRCHNKTTDPSGLCHLHRRTPEETKW